MTQAQTTGEHPLVGQTIAGKYKIVRLLGEGGMGCVYQGEQKLGDTIRRVAVKTLHQHLSHDKSILARFEREVGTVAALEHPNTIQVFDFGKMDDGTLYIVMEFVEGRSVADVIEKDGAMAPDRVQNILKQVTGSLAEAHGHGIVHRDLKPDNVVLATRAGQADWVEVLDFGIAKRSSEHDPNEAKLTQQGMVLGTPPYMSPEQFTGQPVDVRSDVYALGVMAYEMLSGRLPWDANTAWEWASKHMTEAPIPLERQPLGPNVPEPMRAAIARALAKDKEQRFGSVREFFDAFSGGGGGVTSIAGPPSVAAGGSTAVIGATSGPASGRAKTEMGAPMPMMGGPSSAPHPPAYTPSGSAAVVPAPPPRGDSEKKGSPVIPIVLGGLAVVLLLGAGGAWLATRKKDTPVPPIDMTSSSLSAAASGSMTTDNQPPEVTSAAPTLDGTGGTKPIAHTTSSSGGAAQHTPSAKPSTAPIPTPKPALDPPICGKARDAKAAHRPPAIVASLEAQCKAAGGTP